MRPDIEPYSVHTNRAQFLQLSAAEQAQCDSSAEGFAVYGDVCEKHARALLGVYVDKSTAEGGGMGLFTAWPREPGEVICEYTGDVRLHKDIESSVDAGKYAIELPVQPYQHHSTDSRYVIDAVRTTDGFARYANDLSLGEEDEKRMCNCEFRAGDDLRPPQNENRVFLTAVTAVVADSELSAPYGSEYWTDDLRESDGTPRTHCAHSCCDD